MGQRRSIAREDVSRGRLGCPTCPRVGDPRADTRPPPYSTVERRPESRPLKATARADRRPVKGAEATSDIVRGCPPKGSPNGPKKRGAPEQNTGDAPRRTRPRREPGDAADGTDGIDGTDCMHTVRHGVER